MDEGQNGAPLPKGATVAPFAPHALTPPRQTSAEAKPQLGGGGRTLEDIVRELLRPMLRSWFDENLRSLIQRELQAEIAREAREIGLESFP